MIVGSRDVGATLPTGDGRLVPRELRLHDRPNEVNDRGPIQSTKARGELERSQVIGDLRSRRLGNPNEQVGGPAENGTELGVPHVRSIHPLAKEAGDEASARVIHLVWLPVNTRCTATRRENKGVQPPPAGVGANWKGINALVSKMAMQKPLCMHR